MLPGGCIVCLRAESGGCFCVRIRYVKYVFSGCCDGYGAEGTITVNVLDLSEGEGEVFVLVGNDQKTIMRELLFAEQTERVIVKDIKGFGEANVPWTGGTSENFEVKI